MDLGCLDLGCISLDDENQKTNSSAEFSSSDSSGSHSSNTKLRKNKSQKDKGSPPSGGNVLNRVASQIKKPLHRKTSPLNWFPRIKGESYMKRKIKLLQEAGGMNDTLDETLGHSNPHYCRVEREKMAAREAACKVMEARKAAMVEASWCRILQAARIPHKEAEAMLLNAEKEVTEAFEAATAKGVTMYDTPDRPLKRFEIEISSANGKGSTTHTVRASFETAFDVDKQVAAAVKSAFIKLAHCSSFNKAEFKDLLRKISENPDSQDLSETDNALEFETIMSPQDGSNSVRRSRKKKQSPQKLNGTKLVNMMLERLKCLKEEELASLATIVATCGLNAALANTESHRMQDKNFLTKKGVKQKHVEPELPSLDKFLVKKMTKLEKEVQEAKNTRIAEAKRNDQHVPVDSVPSLESVLVKHSSKLEKEIEEAKKHQNHLTNKGVKQQHVEPELPSLDKFLVKKMTKLEKEVQEAKNTRIVEAKRNDQHVPVDSVPSLESVLVKHSSKLEKEVEEAKKHQKLSDFDGVKSGRTLKERKCKQDHAEIPSLDKYLVKHVSKFEKEVQEAKKENINLNTERYKNKQGKSNEVESESLDNVLVKHVSKLEKEKLRVDSKDVFEVKKRDTAQSMTPSAGGLDQILVKHKSRLEREKSSDSEQGADRYTYSTKSRREAREKELLETWGGFGLGNSMRPHLSRLQRDKAAWIKAEQEEKQAALHEQ